MNIHPDDIKAQQYKPVRRTWKRVSGTFVFTVRNVPMERNGLGVVGIRGDVFEHLRAMADAAQAEAVILKRRRITTNWIGIASATAKRTAPEAKPPARKVAARTTKKKTKRRKAA